MAVDRNNCPILAEAASDPKPSWRIRRGIIIATLIYCAGLGIWAVGQGAEMAGVVLGPAFGLAGAIIGAYVFGAAAEDVLINRGRS